MIDFNKLKNSYKIQKENGIIQFLSLEVFKRIYFEKNHDLERVILILGTGRGGTT